MMPSSEIANFPSYWGELGISRPVTCPVKPMQGNIFEIDIVDFISFIHEDVIIPGNYDSNASSPFFVSTFVFSALCFKSVSITNIKKGTSKILKRSRRHWRSEEWPLKTKAVHIFSITSQIVQLCQCWPRITLGATHAISCMNETPHHQ